MSRRAGRPRRRGEPSPPTGCARERREAVEFARAVDRDSRLTRAERIAWNAGAKALGLPQRHLIDSAVLTGVTVNLDPFGGPGGPGGLGGLGGSFGPPPAASMAQRAMVLEAQRRAMRI